MIFLWGGEGNTPLQEKLTPLPLRKGNHTPLWDCWPCSPVARLLCFDHPHASLLVFLGLSKFRLFNVEHSINHVTKSELLGFQILIYTLKHTVFFVMKRKKRFLQFDECELLSFHPYTIKLFNFLSTTLQFRKSSSQLINYYRPSHEITFIVWNTKLRKKSSTSTTQNMCANINHLMTVVCKPNTA